MAGVQDPERDDRQRGEGRDQPEPRAQRRGQQRGLRPAGHLPTAPGRPAPSPGPSARTGGVTGPSSTHGDGPTSRSARASRPAPARRSNASPRRRVRPTRSDRDCPSPRPRASGSAAPCHPNQQPGHPNANPRTGSTRCRCGHTRTKNDPALGTPLDPDRYDSTDAAFRNAHAPALWARPFSLSAAVAGTPQRLPQVRPGLLHQARRTPAPRTDPLPLRDPPRRSDGQRPRPLLRLRLR
ncbi:replication initiator [Streptomyces sp. NPDC051567]|uniref:replication initiator n=1 Tax=Streptomyces sp. NPDC051567 TaxID=3365660 RepID=UPI003794C17C